MSYDVIVLGAGGMGSATAYQLARRGARVLLLERYGIPHEQGSSHGFTRIIRLAYFEHPSYVPLLRRAYDLWEELERESHESLLHITGSIDAGAADSRTVTGSLHSCQVHDLPHEVLTSAELSRRFPGYGLPDELVAVWQPRGGFLVPEACITTQVTRAAHHGAEVRAHEQVLDWEATGSGVVVTTDRGRYEAGRLVVAAGSWTGALVPALQRWLVPERQVLAWFDLADRDLFAPSHFPVFNLDFGGEHWYGFPSLGSRASRSAATITCARRSIPTRSTVRPSHHATWSSCTRWSATAFPPWETRCSSRRPACSPTRRTSTSSWTGSPTRHRWSSPTPVRDTASSSPR